MSQSSFMRFFFGNSPTAPRRRKRGGGAAVRRLRHESLEDRQLLSASGAEPELIPLPGPIDVSGAGEYRVQLDSTRLYIQVFKEGCEDPVAKKLKILTTDINITGGCTDDSLTVDYVNGAPFGLSRKISFDGERGRDRLGVENNTGLKGSLSTTYSYACRGEGSIKMDRDAVHFKSVGAVSNEGTTLNAKFVLPKTDDCATLSQLDGYSMLCGSSFSDTTFKTPVLKMEIDGDGGYDTIQTQCGFEAACALVLAGEDVALYGDTSVFALKSTGEYFTQYGDLKSLDGVYIKADCGDIYITGCLCGGGPVDLCAREYVCIEGDVAVLLGLKSSGHHFYVDGSCVAGLGIDVSGHTGKVSVMGDVAAGSFKAQDVYRVTICGEMKILCDVDISTTCGYVYIEEQLCSACGSVSIDAKSFVTIEGGVKVEKGDFYSSGCDLYVCGAVDVYGVVNVDGHYGPVTIKADVKAGRVSACNVERVTVYGKLDAKNGIDMHTRCGDIRLYDDVTTAGAAVSLKAKNGVKICGDVKIDGQNNGNNEEPVTDGDSNNTAGGLFEASGKWMEANGIHVGRHGALHLDFYCGIDICGKLDAGLYKIESRGEMRMHRKSEMVLYLNDIAQQPEPVPFYMTGGGDLRFYRGSMVHVWAGYGVAPARSGTVPSGNTWTLAKVKDGGRICGKFCTETSGPAASAIDHVFACGGEIKVCVGNVVPS